MATPAPSSLPPHLARMYAAGVPVAALEARARAEGGDALVGALRAHVAALAIDFEAKAAEVDAVLPTLIAERRGDGATAGSGGSGADDDSGGDSGADTFDTLVLDEVDLAIRPCQVSVAVEGPDACAAQPTSAGGDARTLFTATDAPDARDVRISVVRDPPPSALWASLWGCSAVLGDLLLTRVLRPRRGAAGDGHGSASDAATGTTSTVTACDAVAAREPAATHLLAGLTVLELGCGTGLGAVCAIEAGAAAVVASDFEGDGVAMCRRNAGAHADSSPHATRGSAFAAVRHNWEKDPAPLLSALADCVGAEERHRKFDVVCAADVLYMSAAVVPVLSTAAACLAPGGTLIAVDAGRGHAALFTSKAREFGFVDVSVVEAMALRNAVCTIKVCKVLVLRYAGTPGGPAGDAGADACVAPTAAAPTAAVAAAAVTSVVAPALTAAARHMRDTRSTLEEVAASGAGASPADGTFSYTLQAAAGTRSTA